MEWDWDVLFWAETSDGWGVPGIHGAFEEDELDGYDQSGVYLIGGQGESLLVDTVNLKLPECANGAGDFLISSLDKEKSDLKYILITHFRYDHVGTTAALKRRYAAKVICHPHDRPIIEGPIGGLVDV